MYALDGFEQNGQIRRLRMFDLQRLWRHSYMSVIFDKSDITVSDISIVVSSNIGIVEVFEVVDELFKVDRTGRDEFNGIESLAKRSRSGRIQKQLGALEFATSRVARQLQRENGRTALRCWNTGNAGVVMVPNPSSDSTDDISRRLNANARRQHWKVLSKSSSMMDFPSRPTNAWDFRSHSVGIRWWDLGISRELSNQKTLPRNERNATKLQSPAFVFSRRWQVHDGEA